MRSILTLLWIGLVSLSCAATNKARDGAAMDAPACVSQVSPSLAQDESCGGTTRISGTTPAGPFNATWVASALTIDCSQIVLTIRLFDNTQRSALSFQVTPGRLDQDGGVGILVGSFDTMLAYDQYTPASAGTFLCDRNIKTSAPIQITRADNPFDVDSNGVRVTKNPPGVVEGTVSANRDGFAVTGSFSTPFCGPVNEVCAH